MRFPQIKIKDADVVRTKKLKRDLSEVKRSILNFAPRNYTLHRLNGLRIRIFPFPRKEASNEYFIIHKKKKYVCLNSCLLSRRYYSAFQSLLHGIAHSFCFLRHDTSEEVFCEFVAYSVLREFLKDKGKKFTRRIMKSVMNDSPKEYNSYFRAARKLERRGKDALKKLNSKAKNRKLSKRREKLVFSRLLKMRRVDEKDSSFDVPELEKGFRRV